ncbi:amidohydrolase family protein [Bythopirellula goksoeyrii]|uniref:Amidohydrolase n=1 Tax=Bythopirellula goksoeyrii TaxID=1400387 RepID=A0A5B9QGQ4_9BACT|nr:amidohydrolase family protein [Bythopirellula goksoeyrii]QEG33443.1 Amidohydrolase [Bythopirellula goksoeyrii]
MRTKHLSRTDLHNKVIDVHSHVGVGIGGFLSEEYPYAQTAESLYYRQLVGQVDVNVVFPLLPDLSFDLAKLRQGKKVLSKEPLSSPPYVIENRMLMREVFDYCPEHSERFLPFISVDPGRYVAEQLTSLNELEEQYPIYGIKIHPVGCLSHASELLKDGEPLLDFAQQRDIPILFHATTLPNDEYSQASDLLQIAASRPRIRFCLAHCLIFNREMLDAANEAANVWVDTAAIKIQVDLVVQCIADGMISRDSLVVSDYSNHCDVMRTLCEIYPDMILWGTDSPAYTYFCRRQQGDDVFQEFALKGRYEDEVAALSALPAELRQKVSNGNTLNFLFGGAA